MTVPSFTVTVQHEVNSLFFGELLGEGTLRRVYEHALDPTKVIKVATRSRDFSNVMEWEIWNEVRGTSLERWFAPVHHISHSGSVLIMERCRPCYELPSHLPSFLCDIKRENFGVLNGVTVACDYGNQILMERGLKNWRMAKVSQRDRER